MASSSLLRAMFGTIVTTTRPRVNSSRAEPPLKGNTCIPLTGRSRAARQGAKQLVAGVQYGINYNTSSLVRQVRPPPMPFFRFQKILRLLLWNNRWKSHRYQGFCPPLTDADTSTEPSSTHRMRTNTHPGHVTDETPGKCHLSHLAKERPPSTRPLDSRHVKSRCGQGLLPAQSLWAPYATDAVP